jgi:beta-phosphoglucomutase-like phosphatase (HAD superfamily)
VVAAWDFPLVLPAGEFAGYIFDCDGTLIDSMPLHWEAWRHALEAQRAPFEFTEAMHHGFAGQSIPETVAVCNARYGCRLDPGRVEADRTEFFFSHLDRLRLVEPVVGFARSECGRRPLAVASGSDRNIVKRELDHFGLSGLFPVVVTADDVARSKPAPDLFLLAARRLGLAPESCLVFEDGRNGLVAAEAAGMKWVYVPTNDGAPGRAPAPVQNLCW